MSDGAAGAGPLRRRLGRPGVIGGTLAGALGLWVMAEAAGYPLGSARRMGPGYFPTMLGGVLAMLGAALAWLSLWRDEPAPEDATTADPRALLAVLAGLAAFALILPRAGLVPAVAALVLISAQGSGQLRPLGALALAAALAGISWTVFSVALGLPLPAFAGRG
jgi:hypothetical protein